MSEKQIDMEFVSTTVGMRAKSGFWDWLYAGQSETADDILYSMFPQLIGSTNPTILWGCQQTGTPTAGNAFSMTYGGAWYANLKLRFLNTFTSANLVTGAVVCIVKTRNNNIGINADPTAFSDGSTHNVCQEQYLEVVDGDNTAPGYLCNVADLNYLYKGWTNVLGGIGFQNSWANKGTGWQPAQYIKKDYRTVQLRMAITGGSLGSPCFTLPVGLRPIIRQYLSAYADDTTMGYVDTNGDVVINLPSGGGNTTVLLTGEFNLD